MKGLIEFVWTQLISTLGPLTVTAVGGLFSFTSFLCHQVVGHGAESNTLIKYEYSNYAFG